MPSAPPLAALGLGDTASPEQTRIAAQRLREHIQARAADSDDPTFIATRQAELRALDTLETLDTLEALDTTADSKPRNPARAPRWIIAWALLASLAALALGLAQFVASEPAVETVVLPSVAIVSLSAEPAGTQAQILSQEDEHVAASGESDAGALEVPPGAYTIRVAHPDCPEEWSKSLLLEAGERKEFAPRLCLGAGVLVVRSNVSEDRLQIDGIDVGSTGATFHALRVGKHTVEVSKSGYAPWRGEVKILPDESLTLRAELESVTSESATAAEQRPPAPSPAVSQASSPERTVASAVDVAERIPASAEQQSTAAPTGGRTREPVPPRTGDGGSKTWHDAVRQSLVSEYDRNQSRSLDTPEEIESIPCEVWQSIEQSYETGGLSVDMTHLYGFDGTDAPANTLGVTQPMRGYAYDRMKQCGLKARR